MSGGSASLLVLAALLVCACSIACGTRTADSSQPSTSIIIEEAVTCFTQHEALVTQGVGKGNLAGGVTRDHITGLAYKWALNQMMFRHASEMKQLRGYLWSEVGKERWMNGFDVLLAPFEHGTNYWVLGTTWYALYVLDDQATYMKCESIRVASPMALVADIRARQSWVDPSSWTQFETSTTYSNLLTRAERFEAFRRQGKLDDVLKRGSCEWGPVLK